MQRSPFPGMDPYLETRWRDVHTAFMVYARDAIQQQLPGDLQACVQEGVTIDLGDDLRAAAPDISVIEDKREAWSPQSSGSTATVAEPLIVSVTDLFTERHIEIIDPASGDRIVTAIELLSPSNKIPGEGRELYRRKQQDYLSAGVNLVEIDLVRSGVFTLAVPSERIPEHWRTTYQICVRPAVRPDEAFVYRASLRERLPTIPIPLRPTDRDVTLDLQSMIDLCYERGRHWKINYAADPKPPLPLLDAQWADELLRQAGRRNAP